MIIRKPSIDDVNQIYKIARENSIGNNRRGSSELKKGFLVSNYSITQYNNYILNSKLFYVLEEQGQIKAFLLAFSENELDKDASIIKKIAQYNLEKNLNRQYVVLKQICVGRENLRRGYATQLYNYFIENIDKDIYLAVVLDPYNEASMNFHNRMGFKQVFETTEEGVRKAVFQYKKSNNI
jgi:predicted GNAT superfamily acetyltransferase